MKIEEIKKAFEQCNTLRDLGKKLHEDKRLCSLANSWAFFQIFEEYAKKIIGGDLE